MTDGLDKMIEIADAPQAVTTSWGFDQETGFYALVLEDVAGKPLAVATYTYEHWVETFANLRRAHEQGGRD